ncbi:hypothetical protein MUG78_16815 [Gordonia alkaliphila]|uniref:hypothetical protein n=1 Tax=Gordonia alkaliphila TaxID=1053547 RepID=UPI001FF21A69|nr:hypothetical protein [Gordonia alkaliphila]MCK0441063.1 hypothetical protein [Gordonia alkaliphila]
MVKVPVSLLDELGASDDVRRRGITLSPRVWQEFLTSVVPELKKDLLEGETLDGLYIDGGSCRVLWTAEAQRQLRVDNMDYEFELYELGLEGEPFSADLYNSRRLDALTAYPVDALLRGVLREHVTKEYGIDPLNKYDQVEWV